MKSIYLIIFGMISLVSFEAKSSYISKELVVKAANEADVEPALFYGLLLQESGKGGKPWLWTLGTRNKGYFLKSKNEAVQTFKKIVEEDKFVDVGPAQVNWYYHGKKVDENVQDLLDPETNVILGARVLKECISKFKSIVHGLSCYNTGRVTPVGLKYAKKVINNAKRFGYKTERHYKDIKQILIAAANNKGSFKTNKETTSFGVVKI